MKRRASRSSKASSGSRAIQKLANIQNIVLRQILGLLALRLMCIWTRYTFSGSETENGVTTQLTVDNNGMWVREAATINPLPRPKLLNCGALRATSVYTNGGFSG